MTMGCEIELEKVGSRKLDKRIEKKFFVFIFHYLHVTDNSRKKSDAGSGRISQLERY